MTFYLFFPVFFYYLRNSLRLTALVVFASILYFKALSHVERWLHAYYFQGIPDKVWQFFTDLWFPSQLPVFLIGFLAFHLITHPRVSAVVKRRGWAVGLFCLCGLILLNVFDMYHAFIPNLFLIVLTLGAICVIFSGETLPGLVNPAIRYLGKISYSCYLVHFAALGITLNLMGIHNLTATTPSFDTGQAASNLWLFVKIMFLSLFFTVVISTVTMHLIENPGIALGRKIISRLNAPATARKHKD
jgi:peptidoglycan/LPS O-acetylase OafA/YrhL